MVLPLAFVMFIAVGFLLGLGVENTPIHRDSQDMSLDTTQKKILYLIGGLIFLLLLVVKNF